MNNNDAGADSLRDILTTAGNNDTITFDASLSGQTITLVSDLPQITVRNLTIDASALAQPVTIDANGNRLLSHTGNGRLTLRNLVLTGGTGTDIGGRLFGGGVYSAGDIVIEDSIVRENEVARDGGGLFSADDIIIRNSIISNNTAFDDGAGAYSEDDLTVENSTISNNFANDPANTLTSSGGGLTVEGNLTITNSVVSGNRADRGGGADTENRVTITGSTFSNNEAAEQDGGGLRSRQNRNVRISDSTFTNNRAVGSGGAIYSERRVDIENSTLNQNQAGARGGAVHIVTQGRLVIRTSTFRDNQATENGGAIYSERRVDIENSTLNQNQAGTRGGAVFIHILGRLVVTASTLSDNVATNNDGGAIYSERYTIITGSTLSNNQSGNDGGAIDAQRNLEITSSIITGNQAADNGGGIHANRNVTISNSHIAGNLAADRGGGLRKNGNGNVTFINTTVAGNRAVVAGGGVWIVNNRNLTLDNTLVLGNAAGTDDQLVVNPGRLTSNNSAAELADLTPAVDITGVFVAPQAPASAPTTAGDYRLLTDSPALDAGDDALALDPDGNALTVDLAGNPRFQDVVDIGAYEGGFARSGGGSVINPNQDVQIRNGATLEAESITSGAIEPFYYGPFKRNETVVLELLVRNPGAKVLELGELILPSFLTPAGEPLPETLNTFESALLSLQVDTSQAGRFTGEISLESNDPDAFENPFVFDIVITVTDTPANALQVLPGAPLEDITVTPAQQDVPVYSFRLNVPVGSVPVTLDAISLNVEGMTVLDEAQALTLYLDGGIRGERDRLDVPLATLTAFDAAADTVTFSIPARTLSPDVPLWFLVVADFE
jgi:predicted outer membrane repeat protein